MPAALAALTTCQSCNPRFSLCERLDLVAMDAGSAGRRRTFALGPFDRRKGRLELLGRVGRPVALDDGSRRDGAPALDLVRAGIIRCPGHPVGLCDDAGVAVPAGAGPDRLPYRFGLIGLDRPLQEKPVMKIA